MSVTCLNTSYRQQDSSGQERSSQDSKYPGRLDTLQFSVCFFDARSVLLVLLSVPPLSVCPPITTISLTDKSDEDGRTLAKDKGANLTDLS